MFAAEVHLAHGVPNPQRAADPQRAQGAGYGGLKCALISVSRFVSSGSVGALVCRRPGIAVMGLVTLQRVIGLS